MQPVTATCPKCGNAFRFTRHLEIPTSPAAAPETTTPPVQHSESPAPPLPAGTGPGLMAKAVFSEYVPVAVCFGMYVMGTPWLIPAILLLTAQYWYGPVMVYFRQWMPTTTPMQPVSVDALPPEHHRFYDRAIPVLEAEGFALKGRFTNAPQGGAVLGTVTLMQHQATSDVAHLLATTNRGRTGKAIGFSRTRSDGSKIYTSWSTVASPFPPNPRDNILRTGGRMAPLDLWRVHQTRVAEDPGTTRNGAITDPLGYQLQMEREGVRTRLASGLWRQAESATFIRPTAAGALQMCLRMLFPWKQLNRLQARTEVRRHLKRWERGEVVAAESCVPLQPQPAAREERVVGQHSVDLSGALVQGAESAGSASALPPPPAPAVTGKKGRSGVMAALAVAATLALKFLKPLLVALKALKFGAVLKTGLTMIVSIWFYALAWGWAYGVAFVLLLFVHEMGHACALKGFGVRAGVPVFIPFVGAFIAMKEMPRNVRIEAWTGIAGPLMGTAGAAVCWGAALCTGSAFWMAVAYTGFFINLFNMIPVTPLDGGRVVAAISPKLWIIGFIGILLMLVHSFNPILLFILFLAGRNVYDLWKNRDEAPADYYAVDVKTKVQMSLLYFGLLAFLVIAMSLTHVQR